MRPEVVIRSALRRGAAGVGILDSVITVRNYRHEDLDAVIEIFQRAIREIASRDYNLAQVDSWSRVDRGEWAEWRLTRPTWVAEIDGQPVGFSDLEADGHLDMMFVHPSFQGVGVATALLERVEREAQSLDLEKIFVEASITARPFFERRGFQLAGLHPIEEHGLVFTTFRMIKPIKPSDV